MVWPASTSGPSPGLSTCTASSAGAWLPGKVRVGLSPKEPEAVGSSVMADSVPGRGQTGTTLRACPLRPPTPVPKLLVDPAPHRDHFDEQFRVWRSGLQTAAGAPGWCRTPLLGGFAESGLSRRAGWPG